ncbi:dynamin-related protein 4c-like [Trifolium pratense]|uniref:Dynamin-related protein 4c-like n=1 Tax=Trifolium pratense TaxID=57577 RepID=A0A2K3N6W4_TRIPR|nr:dynamin-related protein 4c-like [Trifolium pratense]
METSPGLNSKACEYEYELQRLSWFWVRQLRLEDPKLDWEKLKRAIFERLFFNTLPNNNSITMETLTLPPPMPPEPPDRVSFRRLHSIYAWSAIINRCLNNEQVVAFDLFKDMHRMPTIPGDFEDKHMLCATRLLEMLNLYASNHENCAESDPIKNFIIEGIKVLKEVKWIGLPNFMPQAAFLSLLQRKLQVSSQRSCEKLIAKQKNSIQHAMEAVECGKAKVTRPLLDGLCTKVPKVLAPEPQLADTCSYCSDIFYGGSSSVFANIHCYFDDSAGVRIFDFVSKAGGNEFASLLSFMKLYTYPIDNSYGLDMISHAIRNFAFECSGESWLKVLILYNEAFVERSTLVLQHIVTIREVVMPFSVEIILINKCFTQVSQQGAQLCFVFKAKLNQTLEAATCNFHMAIELPTCLIDVVICTYNMKVRTYGYVLMLVINYANIWVEANLDIVKSWLIHVYNSLSWKLGRTPPYAIISSFTKGSKLLLQCNESMTIWHRKMIYRGHVLVTKIMLK